MVVLDDVLIAPPERSLQQRMDALANANRVRTYRAQVKRDLTAGRRKLIEVLDSDDPLLASMKVHDLLLAVPSLGRTKVRYALERARVSSSKTVGGMTERQRRDLVLRLSVWPSVRCSIDGPVPASVRPGRTMGS